MATAPTSFKAGFHYGGSINMKTGRLSRKPEASKLFSRMSRIEKLVRLDTSLSTSGVTVPDADIARIMGRSTRYLRVLRESADYLKMRITVQTGISLDIDQSAATIKAYRIQHFKEMLPDAIRVIADELARPAVTPFDRKLKIELAKDLMDREGTFPKISKTENKLKIEHDFTQTDAIANELLSVMDSPTQYIELPQAAQRALEANSSFTNSETLSSSQQEEALQQLEAFQPPSTTVVN